MTDQDVLPPPRPQRPSAIRNLLPRLPERGHVKIGGLGETRQSKNGREYQLPVKYSAFKITTLERGKDGNFVMDKALHDKLGLGDEPTEIPIRLLYDDINLSFQTRYASYAGKLLWCNGDGVEAYRASREFGKPPLPEPFKVSCPCHRQAPDFKGDGKCKINGRLSFLIDGAAGIGGVYTLRTTSFNTVTGIASSLTLLRAITGGILANIPLKLRVQPKQAQSPTDGSPVLIYLVSIEFAGDIEELQQIGHRIALDRATTHMSIAHIEEEARRNLMLPGPADAVLPGDNPDEIVAEFYPEQNEEMAGTIPDRPTREQPTDEPEPEPEATYSVITVDGEVKDVPLSQLAKAIEEIFTAAASVGHKVWYGVGETNAELINLLRQDGHDALADTLIQIYENAEPPKQSAMSRAAAPAQPQETQTAPQDAPEAEQAQETFPRHRIWDQESFEIALPMKGQAVQFQALRDALINVVDQAETPAELTKFIADNEPHMRRLKDAFAKYEATVRECFIQVGKRLAAG